MWGGALPGTVRSLPVVAENRKYMVLQSVRVQQEYSYDADFLYGRLLCGKICVVKMNGRKVDFQPAKNTKSAVDPCAPFLS